MLQSTHYGNFFDGDFTLLSKTLEKMFPEQSRGNIHETTNKYTIQIAIPGFAKEQITLENAGNNLVIAGELTEKVYDEKKSIKVHQQEFLVAPFKRKFTIPASYDVNKAVAKLENGILTIQIEKEEPAPNKRLQIQ